MGPFVRVYATENATQRGNSTTALAFTRPRTLPERGNSATAMVGTIASAVRVLARAILLGHNHISTILQISEKVLVQTVERVGILR